MIRHVLRQGAAQTALHEANEKNYEFMRSLGSAEQAKQTLHGQVRVAVRGGAGGADKSKRRSRRSR